MRKVLFLLVILMAALCGPLVGAEEPAGTGFDSRHIRVDKLDQPIKLSGQWLFTREDNPANKAVDLDTSKWVMIGAPGPWKHAYDDHKNFTVGWYRGVFEFNPALVGQEVVFLVDTYMGRMAVFVDGAEVYERPENINVSRFYSIQPVPVRFKIAQPRQVVAIRVDTALMTGIYELPFELHRYNPQDTSLAFHQFRGGEARMIVAYLVLFFGLFFLLVYAKTRYSLYLVAALYSLAAFPFYAAPGDIFLKVFAPESMLYLHYTGMWSTFLAYLFSQYYFKFTPKFNWIFGGIFALIGLRIGLMAWFPDVNLFQHLRGVYFMMVLISGIAATVMLVRAVLKRKTHSLILLVGTLLFLAMGINDLLLALGHIKSFGMMFIGNAIFTGSILYVACLTFANTFQENRQLVKELKGINDRLEELVAERTQQLRQKTNDISTMLQNMPQGILTIMAGGTIHPEYSAYLETIFETDEIAGKDMMGLVFSDTDLGADILAQVEAVPGVCIGEDRMNFEFNTHVMVKEFQKHMPDGRLKSLELTWSPICNDQDTIEKLMLCVRDTTLLKRLEAEAGNQKRELEIIGQVLSVSQEKFHEFIASSNRFVQENAEVIRQTFEKHPDIVATLFRNMHTIKGNARTYGLLHLTNKVHEAEQAYDELRKNPEALWNQDFLLQQLDETHSLIAEYEKINDSKLGRKGPGRRGAVEKFLMVEKESIQQSLDLIEKTDPTDIEALRQTLAKMGKVLNLIGTEKIADIFGGVIESMPSLAAELGKAVPEITIEDHGIVVRNQVNGLLRNMATHLFRNSIDHGIEGPAERKAKGKSPEGHIHLELSLEGGRFWLKMRDDGKGLAIEKIRQIALTKGLLGKDELRTPEAMAELIFISGFSTAEQVTEVSGRGVGMDAIKGFLQREDGTIAIQFLDENVQAEYRPVQFVISLPGKYAVQADS